MKIKFLDQFGETHEVTGWKPFVMFGETFAAHKSTRVADTWDVAHVGTGATLGARARATTRDRAIEFARIMLTGEGETKVLATIARARASNEERRKRA